MADRPRCSIWLCPWKAKYSFGAMDYFECGWHGGDYPIASTAWDLLMYLPSFFYRWMRHAVCDGQRGLRWRVDWKFWTWNNE